MNRISHGCRVRLKGTHLVGRVTLQIEMDTGDVFGVTWDGGGTDPSRYYADDLETEGGIEARRDRHADEQYKQASAQRPAVLRALTLPRS